MSLDNHLTINSFSEKQIKKVKDIHEKINKYGNPSANDPSTAAIILETNDWNLINRWNNQTYSEDARERFLENWPGYIRTNASPKFMASLMNLLQGYESVLGRSLQLGNFLGNSIKGDFRIDKKMETIVDDIFPKHYEKTFTSAYFWKYPFSGTLTKSTGTLYGLICAPGSVIAGFAASFFSRKRKEDLYS